MTTVEINIEINKYRYIVEAWTKRYNQKIIELEYSDFYSAGLMGLWNAIIKFDPTLGYPKEKFYSWRVVTSMLDYRRNATGSRWKSGPKLRIPCYEDELLRYEDQTDSVTETSLWFSVLPRDVGAKIDLELQIKRARLTTKQRKILRLRNEGFTGRELGVMYGVTEPCIHQWMKGGRNRRETSIAVKLIKADPAAVRAIKAA